MREEAKLIKPTCMAGGSREEKELQGGCSSASSGKPAGDRERGVGTSTNIKHSREHAPAAHARRPHMLARTWRGGHPPGLSVWRSILGNCNFLLLTLVCHPGLHSNCGFFSPTQQAVKFLFKSRSEMISHVCDTSS